MTVFETARWYNFETLPKMDDFRYVARWPTKPY